MAKGTRGKKTRSDILQTASRLFALNGYFHTSTSDILESVSISKGAFYHHFKSKEDLALAVLEQLRRDYQESLIEPVRKVEPDKRPGEMLDLIVKLNQSGQWFNCLLIARLTQEMSQQEGKLAGEVVETITFDNGKEFAGHERIAATLDCQCYFAKPYHSWERGLNENTNGLIRQYFPKKTSFAAITAEQIAFVEHRLNRRPRKCLDFKPPDDVYSALAA